MTPSDLKNICNYSDKQMSLPNAQLMYVDMISSEDEEYQRIIKQKNRELSIDAILDNKVDELNIFRENSLTGVTDISSQYNSSSTMKASLNRGVISPKIMQINMTAQRFETYEKNWNEVIDFLNQNTKNSKSKANGPYTSLDVTLQGDFDVDYRRIYTKIQMCSNIIAMDGRIGVGTSLIYGKKSLSYIQYAQSQFGSNNINGLETYFSDLIDDDKIIVCRANNIDQPGLLFIDNSTTGNYFFNQTPNWYKQYCWFRIS
jgi:hypothetical protein